MNTSFLTFSAAGFVMLVVAVPMAVLLPRLWHVAPGFETEASVALLVVAGQMALSLPLNAFSAVIVGKQRYDRLGQIRLVVNVVYTGLIVLVLSQGLGLIALALVVAVTKIGQMIVFTIAAFRLEPNLRFAPRLATLESARRLLGFGGWAVVVMLAQHVIWATDSLVVGGAISAAAVAFFAIGFKLPYQARDLLRVASRVVEPAFGALHGLGDRDGIRNLLTKGVQVVLHLAAPIAAYLLVVGEPFLRTWFTPEHAAESSNVLRIITIAVVPAIASGPIASAYYGTNRVRPLALLFLLEAALNLGLSIALVGPYGIEGVALGTALPAVLIHGFLLPWLLCRHYRISVPSFLARAWIGPLLGGGVTYAALRAIVEPTDTLGWVPLIALTGLSVAVYGAAVLVIRRVFPALIGAGPLLKVEPPTESGS